MGFNVRDAAVSPASFALPAAAGSTQSTGVDLGNVDGDFLAQCELLITAPALSGTPKLADAGTVTYLIEESADNVTFTTLFSSVLVQTGAGGNGAAAATARRRLSTNVKRYIRLKATSANTPGDMSAASATLDVLF